MLAGLLPLARALVSAENLDEETYLAEAGRRLGGLKAFPGGIESVRPVSSRTSRRACAIRPAGRRWSRR